MSKNNNYDAEDETIQRNINVKTLIMVLRSSFWELILIAVL